jgi:hypothetical protein
MDYNYYTPWYMFMISLYVTPYASHIISMVTVIFMDVYIIIMSGHQITNHMIMTMLVMNGLLPFD